MSDVKETFLTIYREHKGLLALMIILFLLGVFVMIYTIAMIDPNSAGVKVGYGDIGGYRPGSWMDLLAFPILAGVLAVLHNFLAMKIFQKQGGGIAKVFVCVSLLLLAGVFVVFIRLLGES